MDPAEARALKHAKIAELAQAFASPVRLRMLSVLDQAEHSVDALAAKVDQSRANTSAQLKILAAAGLVRGRKHGRRVYYALASDAARTLLASLQTVAMHEDPALRELAHSYYELDPPLTRRRVRDLRRELRSGARILVDLRPVEEYEASHPGGALSLPASTLDDQVDALPRAAILAYCRGRWCPIAAEGVARLRARGREADNLGASAHELISLGFPRETTR